jgi:Terminase small subunit
MSDLTVLKPTPLNARQAAFARNIAEGRRQREAYRSAGYAPTSDNATDGNASRLLRHDKVQSRVRELQAAQARTSQITAERLLAELEEARSLALSLGQGGCRGGREVVEGIGGGSTDRPDLQRLLNDVRARRIDAIVGVAGRQPSGKSTVHPVVHR